MKKREEPTLKLRECIKSKRPHFRRQEAWRYKRLSGRKEKWRKAEGIDSKMRLKRKGWPKSPEIGYRGPKKARDLHPSGYEETFVFNVDDLDDVDPKTQVARIAHTVGAKKRVEIFTRAEEKGVRILNPRGMREAEEKMTEEEEKQETEEIEESTDDKEGGKQT
jgi:large subunit ribosomal protein L32e